MWTRTDDGIYDICQACNVKIKVRGSKNIYPMKRHLATRRHKAREIAVEEDGKENILEKPVYHTLTEADIRDVTQVTMSLGEEDKDIPTLAKLAVRTLSQVDNRNMEETIANFYRTDFENTGHIGIIV